MSSVPQQALPVHQIVPDASFDSSAEPTPSVAEIGQLANAYFLRSDKIVIGDRTSNELHFLDLTTGDVVTAGGSGDGPGEIRGSSFQMIRTEHGVAVWDLMAMRMTHFSASGDVAALRTIPMGSLRNLLAPLTAVFSDGAAVFRDGEEIGRPRPDGRYRQRVRYLEFPAHGAAHVITERLGPEEFHNTDVDIAPNFFSSGPVIFGHDLHDAQAGDLLVVAQTDLRSVQIVRRDGSVVATIPLSPGTKVSAKQVRLARRGAAARTDRLSTRARQLGATVGQLGQPTPADRAPANDTAPPIGGLLVDLDGRVWLKSYDLPDSDVVRWRVWQPGAPKPEFELLLSHDHSLLDAHQNRVLLHAEDHLGVDRVVVHETGPVQEPALPVAGDAGRQEVALTLDEDAIFDSEVDLDVPAAIGWVDGASFVGPDRFAFLDGMTREIAVVDTRQGVKLATATATTSQLSSVRLLDLLPGGRIVVADRNHGEITVYGPLLDVLSTTSFNPMSRRLVGMFSDGRVLFRSEPAALALPPSAIGPEPPRYRNQAVYAVESPDGASTEVAEAMADEMARVSASAGGRTLAGAVAVILGHKLLDARIGNCLVVAQTDWNEIRIIDRDGNLVAKKPVAPREAEVSQDEIAARRQYRIKLLDDSRTRRNTIGALLELASQTFGREYAFDGVEARWVLEAPANVVAPSIDKLVVDGSRRVWTRQLSLSRDQGEQWQLWSPGSLGDSAADSTTVVVKLPKGEFLLDAHLDQVLVRTRTNSLRIRRLAMPRQDRPDDRLSQMGSHSPFTRCT